MNLLLDTSIFLWYIIGDKKLPKKYTNEIRNKKNSVFLSVASIWECIIKQQIGKLDLPEPVAEYLITQRNYHNITSLPLEEKNLAYLAELPAIHKDPFDRIIVCQAKDNKFTLAASDKIIKKYPVDIL